MRLLHRLEPRALVLVYHRVAATTDDPYGLAVRPETFARQLEGIASRHPIVPLYELVEALPERRYRDGTVALSFDDGYADNLFDALPIAGDLPLTVFVTVEPVLDGGPFWWDEIASVDAARRDELHARLKTLSGRERQARLAELMPRETTANGRPLTADELHDLARHGVTIGAHTLSHPSLASLPPAEQERELLEGRRRLEGLLGAPVTLLAYPFGKPGDVSKTTRTLAKLAGYRAAFTTVPRPIVPSSPRFALPRITVHECPPQDLARRVRECLGEPV